MPPKVVDTTSPNAKNDTVKPQEHSPQDDMQARRDQRRIEREERKARLNVGGPKSVNRDAATVMFEATGDEKLFLNEAVRGRATRHLSDEEIKLMQPGLSGMITMRDVVFAMRAKSSDAKVHK